MKRNYSVFLGNVGTCNERHCPSYSTDKFSIRQLFERVASIEMISAVDLVFDPEFERNYNLIKDCVKDTKLKVASIVVDLFAQPRWKQGSLSSIDASIRQQAVNETKKTMDAAADLGADFITIWPGQDGYDYHFQADYARERTWFADGVREACLYRPKTGIALEYKIREPRTHNYINTVGTTILTVKEVAQPNCGITLDVGHAFFSYENSAESVALINKWGGNLMHIHINDNYAYADDDIIVGASHTIEYLELFYWLNKTGYKGWYTIDQFAYREDGREAARESALWLDALQSVIDMADPAEIEHTIARKDAIAANRLMRKLLFGS